MQSCFLLYHFMFDFFGIGEGFPVHGQPAASSHLNWYGKQFTCSIHLLPSYLCMLRAAAAVGGADGRGAAGARREPRPAGGAGRGAAGRGGARRGAAGRGAAGRGARTTLSPPSA